MDGQFNTLSRSYHDNYLQYAVTGNKTFKTAYESAQQGLDSIITSLTSEINNNSQTIKSVGQPFFGGSIGEGISRERDRIKAAEMRQPPPPPPFSHTTQYIVLASLLGAIIVLQIV